MGEEWHFCTRPVCRLRSDRSKDRQIYTRKRRSLEENLAADRLAEFEHFGPTEAVDENGRPGRICTGLCETETAAADSRRRTILKKPSKG